MKMGGDCTTREEREEEEAEEAEAENEPGAHCLHMLDEFAPIAEEYVPAKQGLQLLIVVSWGVLLYFPAGQGLHTASPTPLAYPKGQHTPPPLTLLLPGPQGKQ